MPKLGPGRRSAALGLGVALAIIGGLSLFGYVRGLEARAFEGANPVEVLVAKDTIPAGTLAEEVGGKGLVELKTLPQAAILDGAVGSLTALEGKATAIDILAGEQIVQERFTDPADARGLLPIPEDRQAISVEVGLPSGMAGYIEPGDRVSVIAKVDAPDEKSQYLLQDIQVLTIGRRVSTSADGDEPSGIGPRAGQDRVLLTLAVRPEEAEKLVFATLGGETYFTLLPPGQKPAGTPGRTGTNLFN